MIPLWILVVFAGLANYKASHMISQEGDDGPFDLFKRFRDKAGNETWFGRGIHCFSCTSFWGALIATSLIGSDVFTWYHFLLIWGAISTISFMIWRYFG